MRVIAVANQKGGCGKTTTSINLAASLASLGQNVLLIDNDSQSHSTIGLGLDAEDLSRSMFDVYNHNRKDVSLADVVQNQARNLDVAPSEVLLSVIEQKISGVQRRERMLNDELETLAGRYDFVLIDCAPSVGLLTFNALYAADEVIVPIEPAYLSMHGLQKLRESVSLVGRMRRDRDPLQVHALITRFQGIEEYERALVSKIQALFGEQLFQTPIRYDVRLQEATEAGKSIVVFDNESRGYVDYMSVAIELLEKGAQASSSADQMQLPTKEPKADSLLEQIRRGEGTLFSIHAPEATRVELAGDFVIWIPQRMKKTESGTWEIRVPLLPGEYQYKFVVDGYWIESPHGGETINDGCGGVNSVLRIAGESGMPMSMFGQSTVVKNTVTPDRVLV